MFHKPTGIMENGVASKSLWFGRQLIAASCISGITPPRRRAQTLVAQKNVGRKRRAAIYPSVVVMCVRTMLPSLATRSSSPRFLTSGDE